METGRILLARALANIRARPGLNVASAAVIAACLILLGAFWLVLANVRNVAAGWIEQVDVICFLKPDVEPGQAVNLYDEVSTWPEVESVAFVTKDQALDDLRRRLGEYGTFLDDLEGNPLTDLLEIETKTLSPEAAAALKERLVKSSIVEEVYAGGEWVGRLERGLAWLTAAGGVIGLFLAAVVALICGNTIKLTFHSRRDEIEIALLVGATRRFVLIPFHIEAALLGLFGGLAASAVILPLSRWAVAAISLKPTLWLGGITLRPLGPIEACAIVLAGALLGLFGSLISLARKER